MLEKEIRIRDPHLAIEYFENYIGTRDDFLDIFRRNYL